MGHQPRRLEELEAAILEGQKVSEEEFAEAQKQQAARAHIARLEAKRERDQQLAAAKAEWLANMQQRRDAFEALVENEPHIQELWMGVSKAIDAYADAVQKRNDELQDISGYFNDQRRRIAETDGVSAPFHFLPDGEGGLGIGQKALGQIRISNELDRVVGLTMGKHNPNYPGFLGHGGGSAAKEAGIR